MVENRRVGKSSWKPGPFVHSANILLGRVPFVFQLAGNRFGDGALWHPRQLTQDSHPVQHLDVSAS